MINYCMPLGHTLTTSSVCVCVCVCDRDTVYIYSNVCIDTYEHIYKQTYMQISMMMIYAFIHKGTHNDVTSNHGFKLSSSFQF